MAGPFRNRSRNGAPAQPAPAAQLPQAAPATPAALPKVESPPIEIASEVEGADVAPIERKDGAREYDVLAEAKRQGFKISLDRSCEDIRVFRVTRNGSDEQIASISLMRAPGAEEIVKRNRNLATHLEREMNLPAISITSVVPGTTTPAISFNTSPRAWRALDAAQKDCSIVFTGRTDLEKFYVAGFELRDGAEKTLGRPLRILSGDRDFVRERDEILRSAKEHTAAAPGEPARLMFIGSDISGAPDIALARRSSPAVFDLLERGAARGVELRVRRVGEDQVVLQLRRGGKTGEEIVLGRSDYASISERDQRLSFELRDQLKSLAPEIFDGRDQKRETNIGKLLVSSAGTSAAFHDEMRYTLRLMSDEVLSDLVRHGIKINLKRYPMQGLVDNGQQTRGHEPGTNPNSIGAEYRGSTKEINIAEKILNGSKWLDSPNSKGLLVHEIGHALDAIRGNASGSNTFFAAYLRDWQSLPQHYYSEKTEASYYLNHSGNNYMVGRQETMAQGFQVLGEFPFGASEATFLYRFPNVLEAIQDLLGNPRGR